MLAPAPLRGCGLGTRQSAAEAPRLACCAPSRPCPGRPGATGSPSPPSSPTRPDYQLRWEGLGYTGSERAGGLRRGPGDWEDEGPERGSGVPGAPGVGCSTLKRVGIHGPQGPGAGPSGLVPPLQPSPSPFPSVPHWLECHLPGGWLCDPGGAGPRRPPRHPRAFSGSLCVSRIPVCSPEMFSDFQRRARGAWIHPKGGRACGPMAGPGRLCPGTAHSPSGVGPAWGASRCPRGPAELTVRLSLQVRRHAWSL